MQEIAVVDSGNPDVKGLVHHIVKSGEEEYFKQMYSNLDLSEVLDHLMVATAVYDTSRLGEAPLILGNVVTARKSLFVFVALVKVSSAEAGARSEAPAVQWRYVFYPYDALKDALKEKNKSKTLLLLRRRRDNNTGLGADPRGGPDEKKFVRRCTAGGGGGAIRVVLKTAIR